MLKQESKEAAGGFRIVLRVKNRDPEISEQTFSKSEAIKKAKEALVGHVFPMFATADVVSAKDGLLAERFSAGWPDGKTKRVKVHGGPVRYNLETLEITKTSRSEPGYLFLIKTDEGFDVTQDFLAPIPARSRPVRHLDEESRAKKFFESLLERVRAIPKWFVKQNGRFVETDDRWKPLGARSGSWKVALGRRGRGRLLTETSWPEERLAKAAAVRLLDGQGFWDSAVPVDMAGAVAIRFLNKKACIGELPSNAGQELWEKCLATRMP